MTRIVPKQGHLGSGIMLAGERSGLPTHIAMMEIVSLCVQMKS